MSAAQFCFSILFAAFFLTGCSEKPVTSPEELKQVFEDTAKQEKPEKPPTPEVKTWVDQAVVALEKNDQVSAVVALQSLRNNSSQLTVEQFAAVQDMMARAQSELARRAAAGDPQAIAAQEAMKYKTR